MNDSILAIILGALLVLVSILAFRYYYKNSFEEDPQPAKTEKHLLMITIAGIGLIILGIISLFK